MSYEWDPSEPVINRMGFEPLEGAPVPNRTVEITVSPLKNGYFGVYTVKKIRNGRVWFYQNFYIRIHCKARLRLSGKVLDSAELGNVPGAAQDSL